MAHSARLAAAAAIVLGLASASLLLPWAPSYDPWAWLIWGRELSELELDTTGGPSWKPLPVIFTLAFAAAGDAAPDLWLAVARAGWIAGLALCASLAAATVARGGGGRAERVAAGALAAGALLLLRDDITPWLRQFAGGISEPLLVALCLGAVRLGLDGRHRAAFALGIGAAFLRPEAWPFLALYGVWLWRSRKAGRLLVGLGFAGVLAAWFGPEVVGSGNLFTGAERAREGSGSPPVEALEVLGRAAVLPLMAIWIGAAIAVGDAIRRRDRSLVLVAAGTAAWIVVVAVMAAFGWAGIPRFLAPAAAVLCALGGAGIARLTATALSDARSRSAWPAIVASAVVVLLLGQVPIRAIALGDHAAEATAISDSRAELLDLADTAGPAAIRSCEAIVLSSFGEHTALAWRLRVPPGAIRISDEPPPRGAFFVEDGDGWRVELGTPNCAGETS